MTMSDKANMSPNGQLGYLSGIIEGLQDQVKNMHTAQTDLFKEVRDATQVIASLDCKEHGERIQENAARSHGAVKAVGQLAGQVAPLLERAAEDKENKKEEGSRVWYQRTELRVGVIVGVTIVLAERAPDIIGWLSRMFN